MTPTDPEKMIELAERISALGSRDEYLDRQAAMALGWHSRLVTRLGLSGRTPGSWLWFPPDAPWGTPGRRNPPALTGPRKRAETVAALRALSNV